MEADHRLGLPIDARNYEMAVHILKDLVINSIRFMSTNPAKCTQWRSYGIHTVEQVPLIVSPSTHNVHGPQAEQDKLGRFLDRARDGRTTTTSTF